MLPSDKRRGFDVDGGSHCNALFCGTVYNKITTQPDEDIVGTIFFSLCIDYFMSAGSDEAALHDS